MRRPFIYLVISMLTFYLGVIVSTPSVMWQNETSQPAHTSPARVAGRLVQTPAWLGEVFSDFNLVGDYPASSEFASPRNEVIPPHVSSASFLLPRELELHRRYIFHARAKLTGDKAYEILKDRLGKAGIFTTFGMPRTPTGIVTVPPLTGEPPDYLDHPIGLYFRMKNLEGCVRRIPHEHIYKSQNSNEVSYDYILDVSPQYVY